MVRTAVLSLAAGAVIAGAWLRLEQPQHASARALLLVLVAVVPALLRPLWLRLAGVSTATFAGLSIAFSLSPLAAWPGGKPFDGPLASRFGGAFVDFYTYQLPVDPHVHRRMHMLLLFAAFGFTLLVALAVASRRALPAVVVFLAGAAWPATLLVGGHDLLRGALILVVALGLLAGLSSRTGAVAVPATAIVAACALALSASPAVAKTAFLDWRQWNPYAQAPKPVSVSYVWDGGYDGVHFPAKKTTVLTITAPVNIGTYWRATVLDAYVGGRWRERPWRETTLETYQLAPTSENGSRFVEQRVMVDALRDRHLVGASIPADFTIDRPVAYIGQDISVVGAPLTHGTRYAVLSYSPEPTPQELVREQGAYPMALTKPGRELDIVQGVTAPPFGAPGRVGRLERRLRGPLFPYAQLLARARAITGNTQSPYAAVVSLERWLRTTGGFVYSEQPPRTPGVPPLVGFVLDTKAGYCQHFAGAMALMARLLGIPARVAAGFVTGRYENGDWTVTDHDAHTWVEVWFPHFGWLPFDPTPGRGRLAAAYTDASSSFDAAAEAKLFSHLVKGGEVFGASGPKGTPKRGPTLHPTPPPESTGTVPSAPNHSLLRFLLLLAASIVAGITAVKLVRRRLRYATRDPRRVARACARELADFAADQRIAVERGTTVQELCRELTARIAVDTASFAAAADAARFGPPGEARAAATSAVIELRALKRRVRQRLSLGERLRGFVSLRSLGFS